MSRTLRFVGKVSRGNKPITQARLAVLKLLKGLPGIEKISHNRPKSVPQGEPLVVVGPIRKSGIRVKVRGERLTQELYIECRNPAFVKSVIEGIAIRR